MFEIVVAYSLSGRYAPLMLKGYTAKLYPNKAQAELLEKHFGCARWVYNEMIKINQKKYHRTGKGLSGYDMQSYLPKLKKQYPWLSEVSAQSLQIVCHNLADSYNRFFKKKAGYPNLKNKSAHNSFVAVGEIDIFDRHMKLPKLGKIKYRGGAKPDGRLKRITVRKRAGSYYASALFDDGKEAVKELPVTSITGVDLGLYHIAITSNGEKFKSLKAFKNSKEKVTAAHRAVARCQKGSNRRKKAILVLSKAHEKIRNQRKDYNHKVTRSLVSDSKNQAFGIEDLSVKNMMKNKKLSFHIQDASWGQFVSFLKYKAASEGKAVIEIDRFYPSSKTCYECGVVNNALTLSDRTWVCSECGKEHDRDINAALNIAFEAARNAAHGGVVNRGLVRVDASEVRIRTER